MDALGRDLLPKKLYLVGIATSATAVGGLVRQLLATASSRSRRQAEDALSDLPQLHFVFPLLVILLGGLSTVYVGSRLEFAPTPRWRQAGIAIYFLCLLLFVSAVSLVGSDDYYQLALNFLDN